LMGAAAFGERDPVRGVSANIILGNQARIGTGLFDLMLDISALCLAVPQETAAAAGPIGNMYHGAESAVIVSSGYQPAVHARTPLVTDRNVPGFPGHAAESTAYSTDFSSSNPYVVASPFHKSQFYNPHGPERFSTLQVSASAAHHDGVPAPSQLWNPLSALMSGGGSSNPYGAEDPGSLMDSNDSPAYQSSFRSVASRPYVPPASSKAGAASYGRFNSNIQPPVHPSASHAMADAPSASYIPATPTMSDTAPSETSSMSYVPRSIPYVGAMSSAHYNSGAMRTPGVQSFASHDFSPNEEEEEPNE